ncbi:hypothetical protein FOCC_FOCC005916 [Frankliniella occidentalis]|uniref:Uncharacterized protein LOC113205435 n=1 Tax=Frankliniella occidentalis TaxID=133901 RepID=A0A6J1S762_FRAOC|nr:uncharacterized protein LOC113205435 [Frankliniella occidentalis]KAE8747272.1 hypothetical protein FOCC_FOCC005916 [Frankliniella occidentalis]
MFHQSPALRGHDPRAGMTRSELLLAAATGTLLLALAAAVPPTPAPGIASATAGAALQDQGSSLDFDSEIPPAPTDLTADEKETIKSLFGSDVLRGDLHLSENQADYDAPAPTMMLRTESQNLLMNPSTYSVPSQAYPLYFVAFQGRRYPVYDSTVSRSLGYLQWVRQRQRKKLLEQQLRTLLEKQQEQLREQIVNLDEQEAALEKQRSAVQEQRQRLWTQREALREQLGVLQQQEKEPTPFYLAPVNFLRPAAMPSWSVSQDPSLAEEQLGEAGRFVITIPGPTTVVANQALAAPAAPNASSGQTRQGGAAPAAAPGAAYGGVVTPGVPDSLAQFSRSQAAAGKSSSNV